MEVNGRQNCVCIHVRDNGYFFKSITFALLGGQPCIIEEKKKLEKLNNKMYNIHIYIHIYAVCVCASRERSGQIGHGSDGLAERLGTRKRCERKREENSGKPHAAITVSGRSRKLQAHGHGRKL